jgi:hypothetical protein
MTQLELFRQFAKEFSNLTDEKVEAWFSTALIFLDDNFAAIPTSKQDLAVVLYAAHLCWLDKYPGQGGASRGPILSESDDCIGAKKQYQLIQNSDTWLGQSHYGLSFSNLTGIFDKSKSKASILTRFGTNPSFIV